MHKLNLHDKLRLTRAALVIVSLANILIYSPTRQISFVTILHNFTQALKNRPFHREKTPSGNLVSSDSLAP